MSNQFNVRELSSDLNKLNTSLEAVDMEKVERETLKRAAHTMSEMVRQAVIAEDDINAPAISGPYQRGGGPTMAQRAAWKVVEDGNSYRVIPDPRIEQRAIVLNYGYDGRIYPDGDGPLRFYVDGAPVFAEWVEGPDYTGYWQAAMRRFRNSDRLRQMAADELQKEIDEKF